MKLFERYPHIAYPLATLGVVITYIIAMALTIGPARSQERQPASAQAGWSIAEMNKQIDRTNFMVNRGCSGTLIDARGLYVLTANHCIAGQYETVEFEELGKDGEVVTKKKRVLRDGTVSQIEFYGAENVRTVTYKVRTVAFDKGKDLALLQIKARIPDGPQGASFACAEPVRGERVFIVGNPMGSLYSSVTQGIVSSQQRDYALLNIQSDEPGVDNDREPLMQISGGVVGGNSGGAVYDATGRMIGVPVRAYSANEVLGFAAPLGSIREFLVENKLGGLFAHCFPNP